MGLFSDDLIPATQAFLPSRSGRTVDFGGRHNAVHMGEATEQGLYRPVILLRKRSVKVRLFFDIANNTFRVILFSVALNAKVAVGIERQIELKLGAV